jgi:hypothetical protein
MGPLLISLGKTFLGKKKQGKAAEKTDNYDWVALRLKQPEWIRKQNNRILLLI